MKTKYLLFAFFILSASLLSRAAVISVVNGDNLQTKIDDATAGDVLIVAQGIYNANSTIALNKKLTLIGPGYFRPEGTATIYTLNIQGGAAGSYISGFEFTSVVYLGASNITFIRNKTADLYLGYNATVGAINTSNVKIVQNYFMRQDYSMQTGQSSSYTQSNFEISNNIFLGGMYFQLTSSSSGIIKNNTFNADSLGTTPTYAIGGNISNVSFYNNIFNGNFGAGNQFFANADYTPLNFKYNIIGNTTGNTTVIPSGNLLGVNTSALLAGYPINNSGLNNADGRVILAPLSPAINYGRKAPYGNADVATDAGAFGGDNPYKIQGIPVGPYIYQMNVPQLAATNSVIPVTVKARSNN